MMRYHLQRPDGERWQTIASFKVQDDAETCFLQFIERYPGLRLGMDSITRPGVFVLMLGDVPGGPVPARYRRL